MTKLLPIDLDGTLTGSDMNTYDDVAPQHNGRAVASMPCALLVNTPSETTAGLLGHSGAMIEIFPDRVIKTGFDPRIHDQARFCSEHEGICPTVYKLTSGRDHYAYEMERLDEVPDLTDPEVMSGVIELAHARFWRHKAEIANRNWRERLGAWASSKGYFWILPPLNDLYSDDCSSAQVKIHGDLTLANTMIRPGTRELVLIDPLPPTEKIPPLMEVDFGKLMQSALGWESLLLTGAPILQQALIDHIYRQIFRFNISPKLVEFWTMVHLARIIPYAKRPDVALWAESNSVRIADALGV